MASWTTSTKAATSWSVTRSRSLMAATSSGVTLGARARTAAARAAGDGAHLGPALDGQELDLEPHLDSGPRR